MTTCFTLSVNTDYNKQTRTKMEKVRTVLDYLKVFTRCRKKLSLPPCPSIFEGSITSRGELTQKLIDKKVIFYYIVEGKFLKIQVYVMILNTKFRVVFEYLSDSPYNYNAVVVNDIA